MPIDWNIVFEALGGGVPAIAMIALGWWGWKKSQRCEELHDLRIADQKEHTQQLLETTRMIDNAISHVKGGM